MNESGRERERERKRVWERVREKVKERINISLLLRENSDPRRIVFWERKACSVRHLAFMLSYLRFRTSFACNTVIKEKRMSRSLFLFVLSPFWSACTYNVRPAHVYKYICRDMVACFQPGPLKRVANIRLIRVTICFRSTHLWILSGTNSMIDSIVAYPVLLSAAIVPRSLRRETISLRLHGSRTFLSM